MVPNPNSNPSSTLGLLLSPFTARSNAMYSHSHSHSRFDFTLEEANYPLAFAIPLLEGFAPPVAACILYATATAIANARIKRQSALKKTKQKQNPTETEEPTKGSSPSIASSPVSLLTCWHNILLATFSFSCFCGLFPAILRHFAAANYPTITQSFCDGKNLLWRASLGYWAWLFYLSKYYELIDTAIILAKGRKATLLQTYHHCGVILCLHVGFYSKTSTLAYFIAFNSFIHTIMYTYFAFTTLGYRAASIVRKIITSLQITQFICGLTIGLAAAAAHAATGGRCLKDAQDSVALGINLAYIAPLLHLFVSFFRNSYYGIRAPSQGCYVKCNNNANADADAVASASASASASTLTSTLTSTTLLHSQLLKNCDSMEPDKKK